MFVERVRALLKEKGITDKEMLVDLDINKNQMTRWAKEGTIPGKAILIAIAHYLDTTSEYLSGETDKKEKPPEKSEGAGEDEVRAFEKTLEGLTQEELQRVLSYAEFLKQQRNS